MAVNVNVGVLSLVVPRRARRDRGVGRRGVDRERPARRRRVGVARRVGRTHLEGVCAVGEGGGRRGARARREGCRVDPALEARAGVARREAEGRRVVRGRPGRPGGDRGVGWRGVDRERPAGGRRVGVARRVLRAHLEGVGAVGQGCRRERRRARREGRGVDPALERRPGLGRRERERRRVVVGRPRRTGRDRRVRRSRVDRERPAGRREVGVERDVRRPDLERVRPVRERGGRERRRARGERSGIHPALERRPGLRGRERERRRVVVGRRPTDQR